MKKTCIAVVVATTLVFPILICGWLTFGELKVELCWESGGRWNSERNYCEYGNRGHELPNSPGKETPIFDGYDPWTREMVTVVERDGIYYMNEQEMEEQRHPNLPAGGVSIVSKDRIGRPSSYYLIGSCRIDIYVNCKFGPCNFLQSIVAGCES